MKSYNTFYYLLFVLLIMGSFAAMAQNDYGITILGLVSFTFSFLFVIQLLSVINKKDSPDFWNPLELIGLAILALLLGFRVFYFHFVFVEYVFGASGALLAGVYLRKLFQTYRELKTSNLWLSILILVFHLSIVCYIISMVTVPFMPSLSEPSGVLAFAFLIAFVSGNFLKKELILKGEKTSGFAFVSQFKDHSVVLFSLFFLFTLYMGLTKVNFLPEMYSDEFPKSYFQLVDQAETGREEPVNGKFKYEEFKEKYDAFLKRHSPNK